MSCPTECVLGQNLVFSVNCKGADGTATTPTGNVSYSLYEDETTTEILSGTMTVDFDSKTGFCTEQVGCTAAFRFGSDTQWSLPESWVSHARSA